MVPSFDSVCTYLSIKRALNWTETPCTWGIVPASGYGGSYGGGYGGHDEHVKTIVVEKKVPVPYTVTKHVPYTVEKKVPYEVKVPVPQPYTVEKKVSFPRTVLGT